MCRRGQPRRAGRPFQGRNSWALFSREGPEKRKDAVIGILVGPARRNSGCTDSPRTGGGTMQRILMNVTAGMPLGLTAPPGARALTPTETVKPRVDEALQSLGQSAGGSVEARRAEVRRVADSLFDFTEMSRRALGRHWADRTAEERQEFVRLFTDLMARSYIGKMDRY